MILETITIDVTDLRAALFQWEQAHRSGVLRPDAEANALPIDQRVDESTAYFWPLLKAAATA